MIYGKKKIMTYEELLKNKLEEVKEFEFIDLIQDRSFLLDLIDGAITNNPEANIEDVVNVELLIEDFIKWFALSREIKKRAQEFARKRGE